MGVSMLADSNNLKVCTMTDLVPTHLSQMPVPSVVSCKHGTQDVCTVNKVCKYPSMCEMVERVRAAIETQRRVFY
jgi:hypothetical protein